MFVTKIQQGRAHLFCTFVRKVVQADISYRAIEHSAVSDGIHNHFLTFHGKSTRFGFAVAHYCHLCNSTGYPFQCLAYFRCGGFTEVFPIDSQDAVACYQSCFVCGHTFHRSLDNHSTIRTLRYDSSDSGILSRSHQFQFIHFLVRNVFGIGVKPAQHRIYTTPSHMFDTYGIDEIQPDVTDNIAKHIHRLYIFIATPIFFGEFVRLGLLCTGSHKTAGDKDHQQR